MTEGVYMLIFDAKVETAVQKRSYRDFVKKIKGIGYIMVQKSVYIKADETNKSLASEKKQIFANLPSSISVMFLRLTKNEYENIEFVNMDSRGELNFGPIICF